MGNRKHKGQIKRRIQTNKLIDRLLYDGKKQRKKGPKARKLANREINGAKDSVSVSDVSPNLRFGSFNVRGLDQETFWAVEEMVLSRDFDVTNFEINYM